MVAVLYVKRATIGHQDRCANMWDDITFPYRPLFHRLCLPYRVELW